MPNRQRNTTKKGVITIKNLNKLFRFHSITTSIIAAFSLLILVVVTAVCYFAFSFTLNNSKQMSINYSSQLVNQINSNIDEYIDQMKAVSNSLAEIREIKGICNLSGTDSLYNYYKNAATDKMATIANSRNDITNIAVLCKDGRAVFANPANRLNPYVNYTNMDFYRKALYDPSHNIISSTHVQNLIYNKFNWVISISKALVGDGGIDGVLLIDLNYNSILNICKNTKLGKSGYVFIVDSSGNIIFHPQQQLIYSNIKKEYIHEVLTSKSRTLSVGSGGSQKYYVINRSKLTGWTVVGVIPANELVDSKRAIILFFFMITLVGVIFATACAVCISTTITRPLKQLEQDMGKVEKGDFTTRSFINLDNEIGQLSHAFNIMILRIDELVRQKLEAQDQKRRSELKALVAQIKPHFLYNTLETIIWLAEGGCNKDVVKVTSALATLFRTSISREEDVTSLGTEIQNVKSYLTIQEMRYKDIVSFEIDVPDDILNFLVVKLMLQPVVENAIYHGIKPKNAPGTISVAAWVNDGKLFIDVKDDGVGMTDEELSALLAKRTPKDPKNSIGLYNVNERIKLYFGKDYGLSITSSKGIGTTVHITIPAVKELEAHNV